MAVESRGSVVRNSPGIDVSDYLARVERELRQGVQGDRRADLIFTLRRWQYDQGLVAECRQMAKWILRKYTRDRSAD